MNSKPSDIPSMKPISKLSLITLLVISSGIAHLPATTTTWTGVEDGLWANPDNWTNGVPNASLQAIFEAGAATYEITLSGANEVESILIRGDMVEDLQLFNDGGTNLDVVGSAGITIEAGSQGNHGYFDWGTADGIRFTVSQDTFFTNNSSQAFTMDARHTRISGGTPTLVFDGPGDFHLSNLIQPALGRIRLQDTFQGNWLVTSSGTVTAQTAVTVNGGTLIVDGRINQRGNRLEVFDGGIVTGNGILGGTTTSNLTIEFHDGAILTPGRVGETGALQIQRNDLNMLEGSIYTVDLLNPTNHDFIFFTDPVIFVDGEPQPLRNPELNLATAGDGVTLQVNLLSGFDADLLDTFVIAQDFHAVNGQFAGLDHGSTFQVGGHEFQIFYNPNDITLQLIPEPGAALLLFLTAGFLLARRRTP